MAELDIEKTEDGTPILTKKWLQTYLDKGGDLTELAYRLGVSYPTLMTYKIKLGIKPRKSRKTGKGVNLRKEE